jgi:hypothetical protein
VITVVDIRVSKIIPAPCAVIACVQNAGRLRHTVADLVKAWLPRWGRDGRLSVIVVVRFVVKGRFRRALK